MLTEMRDPQNIGITNLSTSARGSPEGEKKTKQNIASLVCVQNFYCTTVERTQTHI